MNKTISAVMCTYGRFSCVERAINCFLSQTYKDKELIIFNTDTKSPYKTTFVKEVLNEHFGIGHFDKLSNHNIIVINCDTDSETEKPYTNVGAIRRDALMFASGAYTVTWDDDDIFLPHFMQQAVDRMEQTGLPFFKPEKSFFYSGNHLRLVMNTLEASVVGRTEYVRKYGYLLETGKEGLGWYTKARDRKELDEHDTHYIPSYCFNWNDGQEMKAPHKQSGDIDNPDNFNNHKSQSNDFVNDRDLILWNNERVNEMYKPYRDFMDINKDQFNPELFEKYMTW